MDDIAFPGDGTYLRLNPDGTLDRRPSPTGDHDMLTRS